MKLALVRFRAVVGMGWRRMVGLTGGCWALLGMLFAGGCSTVGYYAQVIGGQFEISGSSRSVRSMLADPQTPPVLRERLLLAGRVVEFAQMELGLDGGKSYRYYVALDRPYVVWNLFAAPPLSLDARQWCYPVVGCVPYRGYFSQRRATRAAARLSRNGFETHVSGVPAYSTLGWFDDPLLSTFIDWPEPRLVELLVHETAHRRVWVRDDAAFNESFAEFAGEAGTRHWFEAQGRASEFAAYRGSQAEWRRLHGLLRDTRERLAAIYRQGGSEMERYRAKAAVLGALRQCYQDHRPRLGGGRFERLIEEVNNAYLAALGTYADWLPAFAALHRQAGDWNAFLVAVDVLAALGAGQRTEALESLIRAQEAAPEGIERVYCDFSSR